jgi:hypothetical protein
MHQTIVAIPTVLATLALPVLVDSLTYQSPSVILTMTIIIVGAVDHYRTVRGLLFTQLQGAAQLGSEEGRREQEEGPGPRVQAPGRSEEELH